MKRFFSALIFFIVLIIVLLWVYKASIASYLITRGTGVEVKIHSLGVSLDGFTAYRVRAHEPKSVTTLTFGKVAVETDLLHLLDPVVTIKHVQLDDVTVRSDPGKIDIQDIGSLFQRNRPKSEEQPAAKGKKFILESIEARNIQVEIQNPFSNQPLISATIPEAHFTRVNRGDPVTLEEALNFLTKQFQLLKKNG